jgi:hypothetical protein
MLRHVCRDVKPWRDTYLMVRHGEGVLVQTVPFLNDLVKARVDSIVSGTWMLVTPENTATLPLMPGANLVIRWQGQVASVDIPAVR